MPLAEELASIMAALQYSPEVQVTQTRFRLALVHQWQIPKGARVLEIGCGQGDMTAALAHAVGSTGHVTAVDLAEPSYGAPVSVGESARVLSQSYLGDRIEFHYSFDVLQAAYERDAFDYIVLAHCTWYFESLARLGETLAAIAPWAPRLCLSEWALEPQRVDQLGHLLAVLIQGQVEAFKSHSEANVRSPYSRDALRPVLLASGWEIKTEGLLDTSELDDGRWEMSACLASSVHEAASLAMPDKLRTLLTSQTDILCHLKARQEDRALPSYALLAERIGG